MNKLFYIIGVVILSVSLLAVYLTTGTIDENVPSAPTPSSEPGIRISP